MKSRSWLWLPLALIGGVLFFWVVVMKLISRVAAHFGHSTPCPVAVAWLVDNPLRLRYMQPVLDWAGIRPGDVVLELGPGPGVFTVPLARRVGPQGRVIAVDIQPEMIALAARRVAGAGLANVVTHVGNAYHLPLPDESVDRVFLVSVLQEVPDPERALAEIARVLRPDGIVSITSEFLDPDHWFLGETIRRLENAGFTLVARFGTLWRYTANFRRAVGPARGSSYYIRQYDSLLHEFSRMVKRVQPVLAARYGSPLAAQIADGAQAEYARLIPQLPYIGGRRNRHTWNLKGSAWFLALYRSMRSRGFSHEDSGQIFEDVYAASLDAFPAWLLRLRGWYTFTPLSLWRIRREARQSQQRQHPGDWVYNYLPAHDGYDYGVNFTECGILKLVQSQGAAELMPYLCPLDFPLSERSNLGLVRTTTLAEGGPFCDFRFKHGGETRRPAAAPAGAAPVS
jgi:SAM-dependent methyltransferase